MPARKPRKKAPSNQTGGSAWGQKLASAVREKLQGVQVKKLLPKLIPFAIVFYLIDKSAWLYRHCTGDSAITRLMVLLQNCDLAFQNPLPSIHLMDMGVGAIAAVAFYAILYFRHKNAKKYRPGEEYGSARWGGPKDIEPYIDPVFENNIILTQTERLTMSSRPKNPKYARNKNVIVIGGSGSGKTRFYVKPNLMQMPKNVSYVVTDPKGLVF